MTGVEILPGLQKDDARHFNLSVNAPIDVPGMRLFGTPTLPQDTFETR